MKQSCWILAVIPLFSRKKRRLSQFPGQRNSLFWDNTEPGGKFLQSNCSRDTTHAGYRPNTVTDRRAYINATPEGQLTETDHKHTPMTHSCSHVERWMLYRANLLPVISDSAHWTLDKSAGGVFCKDDSITTCFHYSPTLSAAEKRDFIWNMWIHVTTACLWDVCTGEIRKDTQ